MENVIDVAKIILYALCVLFSALSLIVARKSYAKKKDQLAATLGDVEKNSKKEKDMAKFTCDMCCAPVEVKEAKHLANGADVCAACAEKIAKLEADAESARIDMERAQERLNDARIRLDDAMKQNAGVEDGEIDIRKKLGV